MKPHKFKNIFVELLFQLKNILLRYYQHTIFPGDLNHNLQHNLQQNKKPESHLFLEKIFFARITPPTGVIRNSAILIENISISKQEASTNCGNFKIKISDHFSQFLIMEDLLDKAPMDTKSTKMVRNF